MPRKERKTWFPSAIVLRRARRFASLSGGESFSPSRIRISGGTVSSTSAASDGQPTFASISSISSSPGPMWREAKRSEGSRSDSEAPRGSVPAGATGLLGLALDIGLIGGGVHQGARLLRVLDAHDDHPARAVGILVHLLGSVDEGPVHLDHLSTDGGEELRDGLHRLDGSKALPGRKAPADLRELDEDHVPELLLGVERDRSEEHT